MGAQGNRKETGKGRVSSEAIDSVYTMFEQSNSVMLSTLQNRDPRLPQLRIKNVDSLVEQLLQPYKRNQKYNWGLQIYTKFKKHFTKHFEQLWLVSREQFYQLLLTNCKIEAKEVQPSDMQDMTHQQTFYAIAAEELEHKLVDTIMGDISEEDLRRNVLKWPIVEELESVNESTEDHERRMRECAGKRRVQASSLVLPQTLFLHKMSTASQEEIFDLLKFYRQFTDTLQQIFCSNNLISCPIKNFIVVLEQKIGKKKIKTETMKKEELLGMGQENRKIRKIRETNNNIILYELKAFLEAYTEFVWMFLQLHLMDESNLGKIIQSEVLYGIIFKNLWTFFEWIASRGYEHEEAELEDYFQKIESEEPHRVQEDRMKTFLVLLDALRGELHPQIYLKKLVIFYREVSKDCQNADDLLNIYEEVMHKAVKQNGLRDLRLFRMRNIIEKLLKIEDSSLSGGEITYSWTTWCILIELLKEKVTYKYGGLVISKKAPEEDDKIVKEEEELSEEFGGVNESDNGIRDSQVRKSSGEQE